MSTSDRRITDPGLRGREAVAAAIAAGAGLFSAYWDDAWHTTLGRDSALIPPHLLLYSSIVFVGLVLAIWGVRVLWHERSLRALLRAPGFALAASAAAATVVAAPADAFWHTAFGRDAVLWSPPHLLSVIATIVLLAALLIGLDARAGLVARAALGAALLGASQIVIMEFDTDVPQFAEVLYLPLLIATALGSGWVILALTGDRRALPAAVAGYLAFRVIVLVALGAVGWIAPDAPLALLGLFVLTMRGGAWRWLLAALAISALQVVASATGLSSVGLVTVAQSLVVVGAVLAGGAVLLVVGRRGIVGAGLAGLVLVVSLVAAPEPSPAQAHDPGQGASFGTATIAVSGDGTGLIEVSVTDLASDTAESTAPVRVVARRAGESIEGSLAADVERVGSFSGSVLLPEPGLWFVYAQFAEGGRTLEVWLPVDQTLTSTVSERRDLYEPVADAGSPPPGQITLGALLLALGAGLLVWAGVSVARHRATVS
ncbi:hypothetical protein [uncultured Schumannella sp.]|uniref:hypothetical protein n=1 Tax=uncultured Schumannella sp. TaxID=1195956 RepID=UPI0025E056FF|nr:hypothetical protein [uncultured Schumannella sp.]